MRAQVPVVLTLAAICLAPRPAAAVTITVDGAACTLADAIRSANADAAPGASGCADGSGTDLIVLDADETITGPEALAAGATNAFGGIAGLPDVTSAITIRAGAGDTIERNPALGCLEPVSAPFRILNVRLGGALTLEGITLANGCVAAPAAGEARGGAVGVGVGSLTMIGGALETNAVRGGEGSGVAAGAARGGAVAGVNASSVVTLTGVRLSGNSALGGDSDTTPGDAHGGAVDVELGSLTMAGCQLDAGLARGGACDGCPSGTPGGAGIGGAVRTLGATVSVTDSVVTGNRATGGDGLGPNGLGGAGRGGAFGLEDTVGTLQRLVVRDNLAAGGATTGLIPGLGAGGALWVSGTSSPVLRDSLLAGNTAQGAGAAGGSGGAIYFVATGGEITGCTLSGNLAEGLDSSLSPGKGVGGGLFASSSGALTLLADSTFSGNTARGGDHTGGAGFGGDGQGGGAYIIKDVDQVTHLTFTGNAAVAGAGPSVGGANQGGGLFVADRIEIDNTVLGDNTVTPAGGVPVAEDCYRSNAGVIVSLGFNYVEAPAATCVFSGAGDQSGVDPLLLPLEDHGCAVPLPDGACLPTVALAAASPALDGGSCALSDAGDARGVARPQDAAPPDADDGCDAGAFELLPGAFHTLPPCRLVDTRATDGPALNGGIARTWVLAGNCGIPANATALALNLTATEPTASGHLTLFPAGATLPGTSTLNFSAAQTRANNAVLPLAADGSGALTGQALVVGAGTVHVILDVAGYFE
jgi:hypothetical protein